MKNQYNRNKIHKLMKLAHLCSENVLCKIKQLNHDERLEVLNIKNQIFCLKYDLGFASSIW